MASVAIAPWSATTCRPATSGSAPWTAGLRKRPIVVRVAYAVPVRHIDLTRPAHAYFFGFAQTDGRRYAGTGQKGRFTIELSDRDGAVLRSFATLFDVHSRVSFRERVTNFGAHRSVTWTVCDLAFRRELAELGLPAGRKAATVGPPMRPFSPPDYLRGLIDGDGSVGFTRTGRPFLSFATASRPLADFFLRPGAERRGGLPIGERQRARWHVQPDGDR